MNTNIQLLSDYIGPVRVAYILRLDRTQDLVSYSPTSWEEKKLLVTLEVVEGILGEEKWTTLQSWLGGMNDYLGDIAPLRVIRDSENLDEIQEVIDAAQYFIDNG